MIGRRVDRLRFVPDPDSLPVGGAGATEPTGPTGPMGPTGPTGERA